LLGLRSNDWGLVFYGKIWLQIQEKLVLEYLNSRKIAFRMGINNPLMVARWVGEFKAVGPDALRPHQKGRQNALSELQTNKAKFQGKTDGAQHQR
jgi:transposase